MLPSTLLRETPLCVVDFETTGLSPKVGARVVEVSVARVIAGRAPEIVLDTLVDPEGPVLCTSIHGISDDDVVGAPRFSEVVGNLVRVLDGALVGHGVGKLCRGGSGVLLGLLGSAGHGRHQRLERFDIVRKGRDDGFHGQE